MFRVTVTHVGSLHDIVAAKGSQLRLRTDKKPYADRSRAFSGSLCFGLGFRV